MRRLQIFLVITLCLLLSAKILPAQVHADSTGLSAELAVMQQAFIGRRLSFDMKYTFAAASEPSVLLDSMQSSLSITGKCFQYRLDKITNLTNGRYHITLLQENKLMYIRKIKEETAVNPIQKMNEGFPLHAVKGWSVVKEGNNRKLHVEFKENMPFRTLDMQQDIKSGYLTAINYVMPTDQLPAAGKTAAEVLAYGELAIVKIYFEHYKTFNPDPAMFDERSYFMIEGTEVKPTIAYKDYQVFNASPNL